MLLPLLVLLTWFETQADVAEFLESLHTRGCSLPEVHCEGGLPTELRLDVEKLRQRDSMLRDDAVISALSAWQKVPTLKLLKINGLTGGKVPSEICKLLQLESLQLNGNAFRSVPTCIAQLKIKELFLGNNRLRALPELGKMQSLKKLTLGSNLFEHFPMPVLDLANLEESKMT
mmetsp:Transcript_9714/g.10766  ORF Transcript_9714/g.10766 Transcript_9714/m.10766 type:complete len:174 (-) Transcript_9714:375-896(-)